MSYGALGGTRFEGVVADGQATKALNVAFIGYTRTANPPFTNPFVMEFPTLQLTYTVMESGTPGIFIGRINEIGGIFAQANSPKEIYDNLVRSAGVMLRRYKQREVMDLLVKQQRGRLDEMFGESNIDFKLELREESRELSVA